MADNNAAVPAVQSRRASLVDHGRFVAFVGSHRGVVLTLVTFRSAPGTMTVAFCDWLAEHMPIAYSTEPNCSEQLISF
jgi:hypothetical protein